MPIPLIALRYEPHAHLLAHYLNSQGISASLRSSEPSTESSSGSSTESSQEFVIELERESDIERARLICSDFIRFPNNPKYQQAAWQSGESVAIKTPSGFRFSGLLKWCFSVPFTAAILLICTLIFVFSILGWFGPLANALMMQPFAVLLETQQWWRLIGPAFLHFSALHFVFNLLWWSMLGGQIERKLGVMMLLVVFLVSAVASNLAQALVSGPNFGGLSGVVYALLGFVWWLGWLKPAWGLQLPKAIVGFMLIWLVLGYADILWVSMANTAHTVGLIAGCLLALMLSLGADRSHKAG
ncbi:rhomboid family intramembrane serine protease GlpG [Alteromonas aestuariivivens]|uniref:Rhomboid family intramembrane serine protease GlpG n=1 Tax=Alteromonas aestuariivivens TaxID=1938339 RepID=A0A3D8M2X7_9ALTE|nr:rhomboid family intramembrane serine protease GlpG [Alteromonas aestuariivivens]RDV23966.1 rhomboid family intramembrane serine protease GlpG [Alteromonas aestuariivivens]